MSHLPVIWLNYKCPSASAFMVLELGALVIYDGIKNFLAHVRRGE